MQYIHHLPAAPAFKGRGLLGYNFGSLAQKDLDVYYVEVDGGHDTYMISKRITRTYYILSGGGYFTIDGRKHDVTSGMVVEIPPKVEYSYSGRMRFVAFCTPGWKFGSDLHTKWNEDAVGAGFSAPLPNASWRSRILWWRIFGKSPASAFLAANQRIWNLVPAVLTTTGLLRRYSEFLHRLSRTQGEKRQAFSTYFLRNRPELELVRQIIARKDDSAPLRVAVLGCSTGAEVYSLAWAIRSARADAKLVLQALDISKEAVEVGARGRYSQTAAEVTDSNVFKHVTPAEMEALFDRDGDAFSVKPWLREGITWRVDDACRAELLDVLGPQDIVIANNFLCHMDDTSAEECLRNIGRLVALGGYVIATGVDLDVRSTVAEALAWSPVQELLEEIHEADPSLRGIWPCHYAALEPLNKRRSDWRRRYAAAFRVGLSDDNANRHDATKQSEAILPILARTRYRAA
jgi:chemotaxis methyl-accepting protein methylase